MILRAAPDAPSRNLQHNENSLRPDMSNGHSELLLCVKIY